eukprot:GHVP01064411.1.p1 GENE.GHVP01064411.1~~GHVP01064411.1.p1  ORF type:complete len:710 (+),score=85.41 GHVP01064411.1:472-2601(+)
MFQYLRSVLAKYVTPDVDTHNDIFTHEEMENGKMNLWKIAEGVYSVQSFNDLLFFVNVNAFFGDLQGVTNLESKEMKCMVCGNSEDLLYKCIKNHVFVCLSCDSDGMRCPYCLIYNVKFPSEKEFHRVCNIMKNDTSNKYKVDTLQLSESFYKTAFYMHKNSNVEFCGGNISLSLLLLLVSKFEYTCKRSMSIFARRAERLVLLEEDKEMRSFFEKTIDLIGNDSITSEYTNVTLFGIYIAILSKFTDATCNNIKTLHLNTENCILPSLECSIIHPFHNLIELKMCDYAAILIKRIDFGEGRNIESVRISIEQEKVIEALMEFKWGFLQENNIKKLRLSCKAVSLLKSILKCEIKQIANLSIQMDSSLLEEYTPLFKEAYNLKEKIEILRINGYSILSEDTLLSLRESSVNRRKQEPLLSTKGPKKPKQNTEECISIDNDSKELNEPEIRSECVLYEPKVSFDFKNICKFPTTIIKKSIEGTPIIKRSEGMIKILKNKKPQKGISKKVPNRVPPVTNSRCKKRNKLEQMGSKKKHIPFEDNQREYVVNLDEFYDPRITTSSRLPAGVVYINNIVNRGRYSKTPERSDDCFLSNIRKLRIPLDNIIENFEISFPDIPYGPIDKLDVIKNRSISLGKILRIKLVGSAWLILPKLEIDRDNILESLCIDTDTYGNIRQLNGIPDQSIILGYTQEIIINKHAGFIFSKLRLHS